ncbi:MAG: hydrolase [Fidelibacterota bacterium]
MLTARQTILMVIDVQEKIFSTLYEQTETEKNIVRLIQGAAVLNIPVVWTEQYPRGLGSTLPSIREVLPGQTPLEKRSFSCLGDPTVREKIESYGRKEVLICGIEAHVCVYQTSVDLIDRGYGVHIVTDAVMSRKRENYDVAMANLSTLGARLTSVEMILFELLKEAKGKRFKAIAEIIK